MRKVLLLILSCNLFSQQDSVVKIFSTDLMRTNILTGEPKDSIKKNQAHFRVVYYPSGELKNIEFIPLSWDQRHTFKQPWLPEGIVDTGLKNVLGNRICFHKDMVPIFLEAMYTLAKEGIELKIADNFRYYEVQKDSYDSGKIGVAHPDSSFHPLGKAFDLVQTHEMKDNPRIAEILSSLGLIQSALDKGEWWHWSTRE